MTTLPFDWMWGDPAESMDRWRAMRRQLEAAEKERKERELRARRRKIRKLVKQAKQRQLRGQR